MLNYHNNSTSSAFIKFRRDRSVNSTFCFLMLNYYNNSTLSASTKFHLNRFVKANFCFLMLNYDNNSTLSAFIKFRRDQSVNAKILRFESQICPITHIYKCLQNFVEIGL